ncbi:MAG: voltage-gated potassium channel [Patiriisocius sp.]|jgi:voltage-gated potassium channel Kch
MNFIKKISKEYKFELFLASLVFNLFGILLFNDVFFTNYLLPIGLLLNIALGINLISKSKKKIIITVIFLATAFTSGFAMFDTNISNLNLLRFAFYFLFYVIITFEIVKQIWMITEVSKDLIMGLISGYICLGLVGFFIFMAVEIIHPGSFQSSLFTDSYSINEKSDSLLYYSYITLLTIGYGEIVPVTTAAQKAAIFLGLLGQFYLVILTAVTVGKYINYNHKSK